MMHIPSLGPQCPWYGLSQMAKPNVKWCESTVCGWITEPSNTWSNMAYLLVAMFMFNYLRKSKNKSVTMFIPAIIFVGLSSFIYHASYTFFFQFFDFVGMFAFLGLPIVLNMRRMGKIKRVTQTPMFFGVIAGGSALVVAFYYTGIPIQSIVLFMVIGLVTSEFFAYKKAEVKPLYSNYFVALAFISGAATFSVLDVTRTMCNPNSIIQGHAIWHCLSAVSLYFCFKFYAQFDFDQEQVVNLHVSKKDINSVKEATL